jgi:MarR family transcriptional regulator, organic hydroperoxide resistance regulator
VVASDKKDLINKILILQKQMGRFIHDDPPDAWLALNLTIAQLKSLMFIKFKGTTNFKTLARALRVSPPNVTGIVDRLVEQELVSRKDNPQNRRMQILKVTEKGETLIRELMERGESHLSSNLMKMKTDDLEKLSLGMAALISAAKPKRGSNEEGIDEESIPRSLT